MRSPVRARLKADDGSKIDIHDDTECRCETHGIVRRWGDLDGIQQLAITSGIDTAEDMECLLAKARSTR